MSQDTSTAGRGYQSTDQKSPTSPLPPPLQEDEKSKQEEEWRRELVQLEKEIQTLKSVLTVKMAQAAELKNQLGINPLVEFKEDVKQTYQNFKESEPIQKTNAAFKSFGEFASKKLDDLRNTSAFKSVEEKMGEAYSSVKRHIVPGKSEDENAPNASDSPPSTEGAGIETGKLPEEKVPL